MCWKLNNVVTQGPEMVSYHRISYILPSYHRHNLQTACSGTQHPGSSDRDGGDTAARGNAKKHTPDFQLSRMADSPEDAADPLWKLAEESVKHR